MIPPTTRAATAVSRATHEFRRNFSWQKLFKLNRSSKSQDASHLTRALEKLLASHRAEATALNTTLTQLSTQLSSLESRISHLESTVSHHHALNGSLDGRLHKVELVLLDRKELATTASLNSEMITQLIGRVRALEKRNEELQETGISQAMEDSGMQPRILEQLDLGKERWMQAGFTSREEAAQFLDDLPRALSYIAPEPEVAIHATATHILDLYARLDEEEKEVLSRVFRVMYGREVEDWENASVEDREKSISDVAYSFVWRMIAGREEEMHRRGK